MALLDDNLLDWSFKLERERLLGKASAWWLERLMAAVIEGQITPSGSLDVSVRQYLADIDAPAKIRAGEHMKFSRQDEPRYVGYWVRHIRLSPQAIEAWLKREGIRSPAPVVYIGARPI